MTLIKIPMIIKNNLFKYEHFNDKEDCSNNRLIFNLIYSFISFYALYLAFKCKASLTDFVAACCCPPFYIAYVFGSLGGCARKFK